MHSLLTNVERKASISAADKKKKSKGAQVVNTLMYHDGHGTADPPPYVFAKVECNITCGKRDKMYFRLLHCFASCSKILCSLHFTCFAYPEKK